MSEKTSTKPYEVNVEYYTLLPDANGEINEVRKKTTIKLAHLSRASLDHTRFGLMLLEKSTLNDANVNADIALEFVRVTAFDEDDSTKKDEIERIRHDIVACLKIMEDKAVQKDIERFLASWGLGKE